MVFLFFTFVAALEDIEWQLDSGMVYQRHGSRFLYMMW